MTPYAAGGTQWGGGHPGGSAAVSPPSRWGDQDQVWRWELLARDPRTGELGAAGTA